MIEKGMKNEKSKTIWGNRGRVQHPCSKRARDKSIGRHIVFINVHLDHVRGF